ncbi:MAG: hypothetical protein ACRENG_25420, partial [bacterium]
PHGFLISHNSIGRNFRLYAWEDIAQTHLKKCLGSVGVDDKPVNLPTEFAWDGFDDRGRSAPNGIYYSRMGFDKHVAIRRMVLLR